MKKIKIAVKSENKKTIEVLLIEPLKVPTVIKINADLESKQKIVGGLIEEIPTDDENIAIICNEDGKNLNLLPNRTIRDQNDEIIDVIYGNFIICSVDESKVIYESLSENQIKKYLEVFKDPECIIPCSFAPCGFIAKRINEAYRWED